jgi:hypothetical protein
MTTMAATALPTIFKALMTTFQNGQRASSLSRKGDTLKAAENSPGVLQSYVTYDTLRRTLILKTT